MHNGRRAQDHYSTWISSYEHCYSTCPSWIYRYIINTPDVLVYVVPLAGASARINQQTQRLASKANLSFPNVCRTGLWGHSLVCWRLMNSSHVWENFCTIQDCSVFHSADATRLQLDPALQVA